MIVANTAGLVYRADEDRWYEIPWDQRYFWTEEWQQGEREAAQARANGEALTFDNGEALSAWLLEPDTDDESDA